MKVALLSHEGGGISSVSHGLAQGLSKRKIETTIFSTTADHKSKVERINEYLEVISLPVINYPPRFIWFHIRNLNKLLKLLEDYTIVHAVSPEMAIPYTYFRNRSRKPLITTLHGSPRGAFKAFIQSPIKNWVFSDFAFHVLELPLHEMITRRCVSKSDKVVVCSSTTRNELKTCEKVDVSNISVINNGINFDEIHAENSDETTRDSNEYSIMYAGRLFWMKGIKFLLKAYEQLHEDYGNLNLKIFGKGPLEKEIKKFIANRKLRNTVYFGGFLPHNELIREIKNSDLVVFPSLYESQPMFMLETMACKKPVIAFDLPYAREIIKNEHNGLLAKPCDVRDLVNKIALTLQDSKCRRELGENAYKYVKRNHDWDIQTGKYLKVYNKAIASN